MLIATGDRWHERPWENLHRGQHILKPGRMNDLGNRIVSANAYLGAEPIARALAAGADVGITGRVGDMWEKQGKSGTLDFVVLEQIARDAKGDTVYVARTTLISRRM